MQLTDPLSRSAPAAAKHWMSAHPLCEHPDCKSCTEPTEIEAKTGVQLEELHERRRQARVKRNYTHSPLIHQFPLEIVTYIFNLAFPPPEGCPLCTPWSLREEHHSPLVLKMVCHTWRALALSTPRLWSFFS